MLRIEKQKLQRKMFKRIPEIFTQKTFISYNIIIFFFFLNLVKICIVVIFMYISKIIFDFV